MHRAGGGLVLVEDGVDRVDDRRADAGLAGGVVDRERVRHAFGDHAERGGGFLEGLAVAEGQADAVVARVDGEAGDDQVADAGEAGEGLRPAAEGDAEAGHFRQRAGDQGGDGVVAEAEACGDAGGDGEDVLDRAAELDPGEVVAGVGAEIRGRVKSSWRRRARSSSVGADDRAGGQVGGDFLGVVGAGEHGDGIGGEDLAEDLAHPLAGVPLDALGAGNQHGGDGQSQRGEVAGGLAGGGGGHAEEEQRLFQGVGEPGGGADVAGEDDLRKVARVAVAGVDRLRHGGIAADQQQIVQSRREQHGERGAEGAGAEDGGGGERGVRHWTSSWAGSGFRCRSSGAGCWRGASRSRGRR